MYYVRVDTAQPQLTDEEVALRVQRGDKEAFGMLVERYEKKLLRYGRKFLSEQEDVVDIVQDIFVSVYQNIRSFDTTQKFSSWAYRVAHNAFVNGLRKNSRNPLTLFDFDTLISHTVYEDPAQVEMVIREAARKRDGTDSSPESGALARASKRVVLRVTPEKVASWDHRKLGGAY